MTSTIPTTLTEYQKYVREQVLDIQRTQGMSDENMNAHLRALGLPEKRNFFIPVEVTGSVVVVVNVNDALTEEEARDKIAKMSHTDLKGRLPYVTGLTNMVNTTTKVTAVPDAFAVGDPDLTLTNQSIYASLQNEDRSYRRQCENYQPGHLHYCTLRRGHESEQHVAGDGTKIVAVWTVDTDN